MYGVVLKSPRGSESESEDSLPSGSGWQGAGGMRRVVKMCGVSSSSEDSSGGGMSLSESGGVGGALVGGGVGEGVLACGVVGLGSVVALGKSGFSFLLSLRSCA